MTNPYTGEEYSDEYYKLKEQMDKLPASSPEVMDKITKAFKKSQVIIVSAETGAGKGVIVAPKILELTYPGRVFVSEPRTVNTHVANIAGKLIDAPHLVDYAYRGSNNITSKTKLGFLTDGLLVNYFYNSSLEYKTIIIDEVHERNIYIDLIMAFVKQDLQKDKTKHLVLMSATLDIDLLTSYYSEFKPVVVEVEGRSFPVENIYMEIDDRSLIAQSMDVIKEIHSEYNEEPPKDILVFLPSVSDLKKLCDEVNQYDPKIFCVSLYRGIPELDKNLAISKTLYTELDKTYTRKIVSSTNIAESGITIDGLKYVIESGRKYQVRFDPIDRVEYLENIYISQGEIQQRQGRAGRTNPGICYHLYSEKIYNELQPHKDPEIRIMKLDEIILTLLHNNKFNILDTLIESPSKDQINSSIQYLISIEAINKSHKLLQIAEHAMHFSLSVEFTRTLFESAKLGVQQLVKRLVVMMSLESNVSKWIDLNNNKSFAKKYQNAIGDVMALHKLMEDYSKKRYKNKQTAIQWAKKNRISVELLENTIVNTGQLNRNLDSFGLLEYTEEKPINTLTTAELKNRIVGSFKAGFKHQIAKRARDKYYEVVVNGQRRVFESNSPFLKSHTSEVLYISLTNILGKNNLSGVISL